MGDSNWLPIDRAAFTALIAGLVLALFALPAAALVGGGSDDECSDGEGGVLSETVDGVKCTADGALKSTVGGTTGAVEGVTGTVDSVANGTVRDVVETATGALGSDAAESQDAATGAQGQATPVEETAATQGRTPFFGVSQATSMFSANEALSFGPPGISSAFSFNPPEVADRAAAGAPQIAGPEIAAPWSDRGFLSQMQGTETPAGVPGWLLVTASALLLLAAGAHILHAWDEFDRRSGLRTPR